MINVKEMYLQSRQLINGCTMKQALDRRIGLLVRSPGSSAEIGEGKKLSRGDEGRALRALERPQEGRNGHGLGGAWPESRRDYPAVPREGPRVYYYYYYRSQASKTTAA